ncbi:AAA family ATPase [Hathewaya histolytica]|uniref:AAA family ATPase n=1 Tax=Hathewaya histolytica TaxID=1498 RepID=UPI003B67B2C2
MVDQAQKLREMVRQSNYEVMDSYSDREYKGDKTRGKIVTISSGECGVDRYNIMLNLAITLNSLGNKVLIIDTDMDNKNNGYILDDKFPDFNLSDVIYKNMNIKDIIVEGPEGIHLIYIGQSIEKMDTLNEKEKKLFLDKVCSLKNYDFILIATGYGINKYVLKFIACSDEVILLTNSDQTNLKDAYSLVKVIKHFEMRNSIKLIVNNIKNKEDGEIVYERFRNATKRFLDMDTEFLGYLYEDTNLVESIKMRIPVCVKYPNCKFSMCMSDIGKKIFYETHSNEKEVNDIRWVLNKFFNLFCF